MAKFLFSAHIAIACAFLTACIGSREITPVGIRAPDIPVETRSQAVEPVAILQPEISLPVAVKSPEVRDFEIQGIQFEGVEFDSRVHRLVVIDQPKGPGSEYPDAASAGRSNGALAAINAGFFTPEGNPLGLVVSSGKSAGSWNASSSLGSAVWHESATGQSMISRRETIGKRGASKFPELLQSGPMLVEKSVSVSGLDSVKTSARSLLIWNGSSRWWLGCTSPCSLSALGLALERKIPTGWMIRSAINLDGGRSSDLWISEKISGGPMTRRPPWNRTVRNFLILKSR